MKILTIDILRVLIISICTSNFFPVLPPSGTNFQDCKRHVHCNVNVTSSRVWCILISYQHDQRKCGATGTDKYWSTNWLANYMLSMGGEYTLITWRRRGEWGGIWKNRVEKVWNQGRCCQKVGAEAGTFPISFFQALSQFYI